MCGDCSDVVPSCPGGVQSTAAGVFGCAAASPTTGIKACYKASSATNHFAKQAVSSRYFKCPAGTTAAAAPGGTSANTFCEGIAANYYGTAGNAASAHGTVTACPYGGTASAGSAAVTACTPDCNSAYAAAEANAGTCRCAANHYGTPLDANGLTVGTVTQGCTACPTGYTAAAGSAHVEITLPHVEITHFSSKLVKTVAYTSLFDHFWKVSSVPDRRTCKTPTRCPA